MRRAGNSDVAIIRKKNKKDKSDNNDAAIDATALWDPWDASPPTLQIVATKYIWPPATFATDSFFYSLAACAAYQISRASLLAVFKGEQKRGVDRGTGEIGEWGNGDGSEEEGNRHRHQPHVRSRPAFQPRLRLRSPDVHRSKNTTAISSTALQSVAPPGGGEGVKLPPYGWTSKNCVI